MYIIDAKITTGLVSFLVRCSIVYLLREKQPFVILENISPRLLSNIKEEIMKANIESSLLAEPTQHIRVFISNRKAHSLPLWHLTDCSSALVFLTTNHITIRTCNDSFHLADSCKRLYVEILFYFFGKSIDQH